MITLKNVKTLDDKVSEIHISSPKEHTLDAEGRLLLIPGVIDSHISCGSPASDKWKFAIESTVRGGITTVLDIPTKEIKCCTKEELDKKKLMIEKRLKDFNIPLSFLLYGKGNAESLEDIGLVKSLIIGSLILLTPEDHPIEEDVWNRIFQLAAWEDFPVIINSQNENSWKEARFKDTKETFLEKALHYAEKQNTRLYVLNVSTQDEIDLIEEARGRSLLIYAETTPQHLFPKEPSQADNLWEALNNGIIEAIGSGYHADLEEGERLLYNGKNFHFLNPIFLLPLLLNACQEGKISIEKIVRATRVNLYDIFKIERKDDNVVLIDLEKEHTVQRAGKEMKLKGWPAYTILKGEIFTPSGWGVEIKS